MTDSEYFLQSTVTFTVLKLAKSVVLTMVLMLFTSRLPDYQVNLNYLLITGVYFVLTTPSFENQFIKMLKRCELDLIEGMEELWCPLVTKLLSLSYSTVFMIMAFPRQSSLIIIACYTNIFIDYVKFRDCLLPQLWRERAILKKYCLVCKSQFIQKGIDPICAVCLDAMSFARLTPCKHSFHGHCLRRWLKENSCCPLCKQTLVRG